jgi:ABC-type Fe3+-hydroxamate transport system substrate-binding protein
MAPMRVVSLVPSVTETLLAWGIEPVAVTRFCEQPGYLTVGGTKNPDIDAIVAIAPDLVVVDEEENRREDYDDLIGRGVAVHATAVRSVADVPGALTALAVAVGADDTPVIVGPWQAAPTHCAFVPIWRRPWMTINADTYGASILRQIGWATSFGDASERYPTVDLDEVREAAPDTIIVPTEPYAFEERHCRELEAELGCPALLVDGKDLFWWGARTPSAIERLGRCLS